MRAADCKVLHIKPSSSSDADVRHLGGAKGIHMFDQYFAERGIACSDLVAVNRSDTHALASLKKLDLSGFHAVLIHYPTFLRSARYIKRCYPHVRVLVRSHNAEFPHWLDHARGWLAEGDVLRGLKRLFVACRLGGSDLAMARIADKILAITAWERDNYWRRFTSDSRLALVPYFTPNVSTEATPEPAKQDICICPMGGPRSPLLLDAARNFDRGAVALGDRLPTWRFLVTGKPETHPRFRSPRIEQTGFLDDPTSLLKSARAVASLSDLGYGFKTKILEAISHGCLVLVTGGQHARLPEEVRRYCISVDPRDGQQMAWALQTQAPPMAAGRALNESCKAQVYAAMDAALGL